MDVLEDCLDEVALEGLDGITISALWLRLEKRKPSFHMSLDEFTKPFIWECLVTSPEIQFYELPEPRPPLVINDNIVKDEETGYDIRTEDLGTSNIYPIAMVTDSKVGERGSCATYKERRNITGEVRTEDGGLQCTLAEAVERWDSKLVLVASQSLRQQALFHEDVLPDAELTDIQYCILERVGRARHLGELQADMKVMLDANSKYLFHVRKGLVKYDLITRQSTMYTVPGNSRLKNSVLLLLKRFHTTHKSKNMVLMDALLDILQTKPDQMAVINDLKEEMDLSSNTFKKVYQALEVQGKIKGILLPTKEIYPDPNDPKILNNKRIRKVIRCLKLIKTVDEDEEADEDDIDDPEQTPYPVVYERPFLNQAYDFMYSRGPLGITQHDLRLAMRMGRYEARGLCRSMAYSGIAVEIMEDRGKVRTTRYVAKSLLDQNQLKQQFEVEQLKNNRLRKRDNRQGDKTGATASTTPATTADVNVPSPIPSTSTDKTTENTEEGKPGDMDASQDATPKRSTLLTYRRLRRTNIILEVLKSTKVVDKAFRFVKAIRASEEKEGFCGLLDKKSVLRLLQEMISEGQVKVIKTIIVQDGIEKPVTFYVEPNISPADGMVKSAIEQIKFKMVRGRDPEKKEKETQPKHTIDLEADLQKMEEDIPYKPIKKTVGVYNFQPKFARLKLVHQFLWYLVYVHRDPGPSDSSVEITQSQDKTTTTDQAETPVTGDTVTKEAVVTTVSQLDSTDDQENVAPKDSSEGPSKDDNQLNQSDASFGMNPTPNRVYVNEQSWKRFVPPIPVHGNYGPGWFLVSDVLCVIPLNLFCQFIRVLCEVDDIEDYLSDPEKRHTLVRNLPTRMRHQLLYKRKYLYSFHELMERLSAMGLAKIGPRGHKEKDQIFIYLNKNATIVDTTTSSPGYFIVKDDKDFIIRRFQFTSEKDVEAYWCAMEYICLNTPLGSARLKESSAPKGHVGLETWRSRARLLQFATPEDDIVDDGSIPGDGKGAGGLDSVFFSHLKRNWKLPPLSQGREYPSQLASGSSMSALASSTGDGSLTKPKRLPKQVYFIKMPFKSPQRKSQSSSADEQSPRKGKQQLIKVTKVQDFTKDRNKKVKGGKGQKRKREKKPEAPKPTKVRKRKASFTDGPPRKKEKTYQRFHDNRDKAALSRMKRQRVSWTPQEDSLILRCRVASALLNKKVQQSFVPWVVVRDLLHDTFQASEDKTTLSVARRSTYIMKNSQTALNFKIGLAEVHQDKEFMSWISSMNGDYTDPGVCAEEYRIVVGKLQEKFRTCPGGLGKCNHIGGLLFAIEAFNKTDLKEQPTPVSCTSKSSTWNVPRNDKVEAQPITGVRLGKIRYGKETKFLQTSHYDPRAPHQREVDVTALAIFKKTLQADQPESMFHLYGEGCSGNPPPSDACQGESGDASRSPTPSDACQGESGDASRSPTPSDACRAESGDARPAPTDPSDHDSHLPDLPFNDHYDFSTRSFIHMMDTYMKTAKLTKEEQINIEEETRGQSSSTAWKEKRKEKLTASNFKSAITCTVEPSNKIKAMLYNSFSTAATEYGNRNEAAAVEEYVNLIQEEHPGAHCVETGLILSLERPWLGASVDGLVRQDGQTIGGLEVKCPSSKQGMSVQEASQDMGVEDGDPVGDGDTAADGDNVAEPSRDMPGALDDELPDTMEELLSKYQIMTVGHPHHNPQKTITSIDDIHLQVLRNFIWNCLGATEADKTKFAFLAYKLFNKYPSGVLERAFLSMKKQGLVNQSKGNIPKSKVRAVPMAAIGYKLSAIAERHFQPGMPTSVFPQAQELLTRLNEDRALGVEGQGVEFPSEGSGGHTACVFSLMATNQLSYTVDIPENIVVVDSSVENPVEAAKKVTRKDGSDSEGDTENSTGASKPSTAPGFPNANQASRTKVLAARSGGAAPGVLSLRNLEPTDNIVINSCTVNLRLPRKLFDHEERLLNNEDPQQSSNSSKFLLADPSESGRDPADNAIPWAEFVSICREEFQYSDPDIQRVKDIYDYIEVGEGLGVKLKDLQSMFRNAVQEDSKFSTDDHIHMLIRFGMCLEVGIHEPRLVTAEQCGPWFMHSSRLVSMATSAQTDVTSQPGTSKDNADTVLHGTHTPQSTSTTSHIEEPAQGTSEMLGKEDGQTKTDQLLSEDSTDKTLPDSEEADTTKDADVLPSKTGGREGSREEMKLRPRLPKTPTPGRRKENPETDLQVQMQASKYGVYEPVAFLSRPWRAVDGSVNRQVLQNMLQGVLLRILQKPGISQTAVLQHINTVLPAMAALQLLQMLQSVGCITSRHVRRAPKATLFSAPVSLIEGKGDNDEIYYEPTADAILKLNELFHHT
ncbi:GTF3C1 [Branchiostoma lanceolatum]|uniref:GTF3C1 protein n=1 Tax=Branchiostoma lanceolatum TaxID=7740 RepID=A0A8K0A000_BRALA|nr:GTF3C1 [Branchiostoma lanceolatum]